MSNDDTKISGTFMLIKKVTPTKIMCDDGLFKHFNFPTGSES